MPALCHVLVKCYYTHGGHKYVSNLLLDVPVESSREKGRVEELMVVDNILHCSKQSLDLLSVQDGGGAFS